jgi:hypothetical protein
MAHLRFCYPRSSAFLCVMAVLIFIVSFLDLIQEWTH